MEISAILLPLAIAAVFRVADSLAVYAAPVAMFGDGPTEAPVLLTQHIAETALDRFDVGAASAVSSLYVVAALPLVLLAYGVIAGCRQGDRSCQRGRS